MMQHTAATMALHRDRELRVILSEARGKRKVELRTFSPPVTPANVRAAEREGLTITVPWRALSSIPRSPDTFRPSICFRTLRDRRLCL